METQKQYKLGTRGSLLATTQSTLIKTEIENKNNCKIELELIKTQGDKIQDIPLWQIDGKDFFTKELDLALLNKDVDFVVHSYKDLGSERPQAIELAAITERKFAQDILLIKKTTISQLKDLKNIVIGTSSPRRIENITTHLKDFLPHITDDCKLECKTLRGNVNSRIKKLQNNDYDAIVLALAGIERLASYGDSKKELAQLLEGLNFMVLPQKYFTSSASQGALAIECHQKAATQLKEELQSVHCNSTHEEIKREREAFQNYGGGCHLAVGVHVKKVKDFFIHMHNGSVDNNKIQKLEIEGQDKAHFKNKNVYYIYKEYDFLIEKRPLKTNCPSDNLFITSTHCLHNIPLRPASLWASGNRTMKKLTSQGHWVNGSAEGFGHDEIKTLKSSQAIQMMLNSKSWKVLSHDKAKSEIGEIIPCYEHHENKQYDMQLVEQLLSSDMIYWNSKIQYDLYTKNFPELKTKQHVTGLGKTYDHFIDSKLSPIACIDMVHLKKMTQG